MHTSRYGSNHCARTLTMLLILGGGAALILYSHGASWWYAPLAALAVVITCLFLAVPNAMYSELLYLISQV
jgi:hypothetical protein